MDMTFRFARIRGNANGYTVRNDTESPDMSTNGTDLIQAIREDHQQIKSLLETVRTQLDAEAFQKLVSKLAVHETAEEEVVHPLTRNAPGGEPVVEQSLEEEDKGKKALSELEKMGVQDPRFPASFEQLRTDVLAHAQHEEQDEHPKLARSVDAKKLESLARVFRSAENTAPTHAHSMSPESATGNIAVGPFVAIADRARDAIRNAMRDERG